MFQYQISTIKFYFIVLCILFSSNNYAQLTVGPTVNESEATQDDQPVSFFEKCFTSGLNTANSFDIAKFETAFYQGLDDLKAKNDFDKLKNINKINEFLKANYFSKTVVEAIPQDALLGGRYNNINAVMLQSLALQYLGLNYIVHDTKTGIRVNVVVNTDTLLLSEDIAEATNRISIRHFNTFKTILFRNGRLSKADVNDDAFIDEYFLIDTIIETNQLPALQYFNDGIQFFKAEQYNASVQKLEKAHQLYAAPYVEQWMKLVLGIALSDEKANDDPTAECDFLLKFSDVNWDVDDIQTQIMNVAATQAQQLANQPAKVKSFLTCIEAGIDNEDLKNMVSDKIYLVLAESYYSNAQYQNAIDNFKRLYKRDSTAHHNYIKNSVIQSLYEIDVDSSRIDSLISYEQNFSFLKDDAELLNYKTYLLTTCIYDSFENKNKAAGLSCLEKLRQAFSTNEDNLEISKKAINTQQVSSAYAAAIQYFINNNNFETAKALISEGKIYCGENETFNQLLKTIETTKK